MVLLSLSYLLQDALFPKIISFYHLQVHEAGSKI